MSDVRSTEDTFELNKDNIRVVRMLISYYKRIHAKKWHNAKVLILEDDLNNFVKRFE